MSTIFEIADHILAKTPDGLSNRELQKLLYLAQGFYLAQVGEPLFWEDFHAWKHGPVNSGIFHKYKQYGYQNIDRPAAESLQPISANIAAFIAALTLSFYGVDQSRLIEYSHADVPWAVNYIPNQNVRLAKDDLQGYFQNFENFDEYKVVADQKFKFHAFIQSRVEYLGRLPAIGDAWISGKASAPTPRACEIASAFVAGLERQLFSSQPKPTYPKIVMGPIPAGGVTVEFTSSNSTYFHFHNAGLVEIDFEVNGEFTDREIGFDQFEENFSEFYEAVVV